MDSVFGVLSTVLGAIAGFFAMVGDTHELVLDLFSGYGVTFFVLGFFGLLFTFLWFLFRFIDQRRLAMPTVFFMIFFLIFLSGNLLMLSHSAETNSAAMEAADLDTPPAFLSDDAAVL